MPGRAGPGRAGPSLRDGGDRPPDPAVGPSHRGGCAHTCIQELRTRYIPCKSRLELVSLCIPAVAASLAPSGAPDPEPQGSSVPSCEGNVVPLGQHPPPLCSSRVPPAAPFTAQRPPIGTAANMDGLTTRLNERSNNLIELTPGRSTNPLQTAEGSAAGLCARRGHPAQEQVHVCFWMK